jgi:thioredoxin
MGFSKNFKIAAAAVVAAGLFSMVSCSNSAKMNESTPSVTHISENDFTNTVIASTNPVVVDFYATWCAPCRVLDPMIERVAPSFTNSMKFVKVNADEAPGLAQKYSVIGFPTLLVFKDGKVVDNEPGLPTEMDLRERLEALTAIK